MKEKLSKVKLNLSLRIGLSVGAIVLFVTLVMGLVASRYSSNMLLRAEDESLESLAKSGASQVEAMVNLRLATLSEVASSENILTMKWKLQQRSLVSAAERLDYLDIAVVSMEDSPVCATEETADLSDRDILKGLEGEANVSDVIISGFAGNNVSGPIYRMDP